MRDEQTPAALKALIENVPYRDQKIDSKWAVPDRHLKQVMDEFSFEGSQDKMIGVVKRMGAEPPPDFGGDIDWDAELAEFERLDYPSYYLQPFHSVPGGWLSQAAAMFDRQAMESIYTDWHPRKCLGMRDELALFIPEDARRVLDVGAGTCDAAAAIARRLPEAKVTAVEASPFMIIAGRRQNRDVSNLDYLHAMGEDMPYEDDSIDAINITLVLHECENRAKEAIVGECYRVLRPGGTLVLSDTPTYDLDDFRGFFEPYREQCVKFDADAFVKEQGLVDIKAYDTAPPLWTRVAIKPA